MTHQAAHDQFLDALGPRQDSYNYKMHLEEKKHGKEHKYLKILLVLMSQPWLGIKPIISRIIGVREIKLVQGRAGSISSKQVLRVTTPLSPIPQFPRWSSSLMRHRCWH